jgi:hypothetical protein
MSKDLLNVLWLATLAATSIIAAGSASLVVLTTQIFFQPKCANAIRNDRELSIASDDRTNDLFQHIRVDFTALIS